MYTWISYESVCSKRTNYYASNDNWL